MRRCGRRRIRCRKAVAGLEFNNRITRAAASLFRQRQLTILLAVAALIVPAAAQSTGDEFRPELGVYVRAGELLRVEFVDFGASNSSTHSWQGNFAYYVNVGLRPILRRRVREHPDVYRNRYLSMRAGYLYQTSLTSGQSSAGNIGILELTARHALPWDLVIIDRNRGEFRFIKGDAFYSRYRNRLRLERDVKFRRFTFTPYGYGEIFFDTRYDSLTPNRFAAGVEFPVARHMVFDPYYMRQNGSHNNPPHLNTFGFRWNLYF
jgi:hypothetical protein